MYCETLCQGQLLSWTAMGPPAKCETPILRMDRELRSLRQHQTHTIAAGKCIFTYPPHCFNATCAFQQKRAPGQIDAAPLSLSLCGYNLRQMRSNRVGSQRPLGLPGWLPRVLWPDLL